MVRAATYDKHPFVPAGPETACEIGWKAIVERLSAEAGIPMPCVAVMPSPVPNAFATGR
jgi:Zn-dependent protease with chaperone function